jgi:putative ABC transport system permease protein
MTILKLAWRNIWRNKRRTLLTAASIFLAIFLALIMRSLQIGWFDNLVDVVVNSYTGHIQVHRKGYWDDRDINNSMACNDSLVNAISKTPNVGKIVPRLEYFTLASYGQQTKGALLIGTDPERENSLTKLSAKIVKGRFLESSGNGILLAQGLATYLGLTVGDTLVLIGQGYHGVSAAGKYPVAGIVHFPAPQLDNQMIYMNLASAQEFFGAENRITSLSLTVKNPDKTDETLTELRRTIGDGQYEIMKWDEMMVELMQQLKIKTAGGKIIASILYMIVGFGIFGTVIMMTNERAKEFGVIVSVGMQKSKLAVILVMELIFMGLVGIVAGLAASIPIMIDLHLHPIRLWGSMAEAFIAYGIEPLMPLAFKADFIISNVMVVIVIVLVAAIYPVRRVFKMKVVDALHK